MKRYIIAGIILMVDCSALAMDKKEEKDDVTKNIAQEWASKDPSELTIEEVVRAYEYEKIQGDLSFKDFCNYFFHGENRKK